MRSFWPQPGQDENELLDGNSDRRLVFGHFHARSSEQRRQESRSSRRAASASQWTATTAPPTRCCTTTVGSSAAVSLRPRSQRQACPRGRSRGPGRDDARRIEHASSPKEHEAVTPPSMRKSLPVMNAASGPMNNAPTIPTSSGVPARPAGDSSIIRRYPSRRGPLSSSFASAANRVGPCAAPAPPNGLGHDTRRIPPLSQLVGVQRVPPHRAQASATPAAPPPAWTPEQYLASQSRSGVSSRS